MSLSYTPESCADFGSLTCISSTPEIAPPACSADDPCLHFFQGMGFRPAAWTIHRDQYGDRPMMVVAGDDAYLAKYDLPEGGPAFAAEDLMPADAMSLLPVVEQMPGTGTILAIPGSVGGSSGGSSTVSSGFGGFGGFSGSSGSGSSSADADSTYADSTEHDGTEPRWRGHHPDQRHRPWPGTGHARPGGRAPAGFRNADAGGLGGDACRRGPSFDDGPWLTPLRAGS